MSSDIFELARSRLRALASAGRLGQFVSVGVLGAICDNVVLLSLTTLGVTAELAKLAGIETAIVVMFLANERWTFADEGRGGLVPFLRRFGTSNLVRVGGVVVQLVVFHLVYRKVPVSLPVAGVGIDLWLLVASGAGIGVGMTVNYVFESLVTWRVHDPR